MRSAAPSELRIFRLTISILGRCPNNMDRRIQRHCCYDSASTVNSSASFSIDNGTLFPFLVTNHSSEDKWAYFQTPILSPGSHRLFVEYGDNGVESLSGSVPLTLDYLVIKNLTIPSFAPIPSSTGLSKGAIAGVVSHWFPARFCPHHIRSHLDHSVHQRAQND